MKISRILTIIVVSSMVFLSCKSNSSVNESGDKDSGDIFIDKDTYTVPDHESTDSEDSDLIFDYENDAQDQDTDSDNDAQDQDTDSDNDAQDQDTDSDNDSGCVNFTSIYVDGAGNEQCPFSGVEKPKKIGSGDGTEEGFKFIIDEIILNSEADLVSIAGECGKTNKCGIGFRNYDRTMFKESIIGKEITLFWKEGFYGSASGEYMSRDVEVARHKDGALIAVWGTGIVNEDGENEWDIKVWPSELAPEIKAEQKVLLECAETCIEQAYSSIDGTPLKEPVYNYLVFPPVEFKIDGKTTVVVRNGESIKSEGYEYYVRESMRAGLNDPDGLIFDYGKKYRFDFFIVNTEALK